MLVPSSGIGTFREGARLAIRFVRQGCTNRPFFHIVVSETVSDQYDPVIEQLGSYDPLPNERNEKLVALNLERIQYWIGNGAVVQQPLQELLGLAGFFPIHPTTYMRAWRARRAATESENKEQSTATPS